MFEQILSSRFHVNRHRNAPYALERERYLALLATEGRSSNTLRQLVPVLWYMAKYLPLHCTTITLVQIEAAAKQWSSTLHRSSKNKHSAERCFVFHATKWMRALGRLQERPVKQAFAFEMEAFVAFEEQERGFAAATMRRVKPSLGDFLNWVGRKRKSLRGITSEDVGRYISTRSVERRWKRTTIVAVASILRTFFRFAQTRRWCMPNLADTIDSPRIYKLEGLPQGPKWDDVQRLVKASAGNNPGDIRDYAMLLLVTVYGFRSGEVRHLGLDDIDWDQELIRVRRPKQRKTQRYPLVRPVGEAILRYLREVRPRCSCREIFLTQVQPFRPVTAGGFGTKIRKRFLKLGIATSSYGPHGLRHSCATRLLAEGFTIKEIADHLGHVSLVATMMYTKVDVASLREVGQLDLSSLVSYAQRSTQRATPLYARGSLEALRAVAQISLGGLL